MAAKSDGAIVGSAIVKLCEKYGADCVPHVKEYVTAMKEGVLRGSAERECLECDCLHESAGRKAADIKK